MEYLLTYRELTKELREREEFEKKDCEYAGLEYTGDGVENSWLYEFDPHSLAEAERLNIVLTMVKWEIENKILSNHCKRELYLYYDDYKKGKLDGILAEYEAELVLHDLTECYFKVFDSYPSDDVPPYEGP